MNDPKTPPIQSSAFISRRQFIKLGLVAVGTAWAGTLVQSQLFPAGQAEVEVKPVIIPLADLSIGSSRQITLGGIPGLVLRTPESIKAFSLICTHLGCIVEWDETQSEFYCPCHDGYYDQFGEVIAGPPPVPLEQFPVQVKDDQIIIGEEI